MADLRLIVVCLSGLWGCLVKTPGFKVCLDDRASKYSSSFRGVEVEVFSKLGDGSFEASQYYRFQCLHCPVFSLISPA